VHYTIVFFLLELDKYTLASFHRYSCCYCYHTCWNSDIIQKAVSISTSTDIILYLHS